MTSTMSPWYNFQVANAPGKKICDSILDAIGNTPMVRINAITRGVVDAEVLAKLETFNPGNSTKDRMAVQMIEDAEAAGLLKEGGTVVEGTSGNTGMGLAITAVIKGYRCVFTTTDKQSKEKIDALKAFGAEVIVCPTDVDPEDPRSYYSVATRLAREIPGAWKADQYANPSNTKAHYEQTGPEIWDQTDGRVTHLVVGVGTGGTVSGVGRYPQGEEPRHQGVGHRHLRLGVQEVQGDRRLRQERDLPLHHRGHRRGLPARQRGLLDHRPLREGDRQGRGHHDAPPRPRRGHLGRQLRRLRHGRAAAAARPLHRQGHGGRDLPRPRLALPGQDVQRRVDARARLLRGDGHDRPRPGGHGRRRRAVLSGGQRGRWARPRR